MILLDTNILLRYARTADPSYSIIDAAIGVLMSQGRRLCIVPQNLYEFWVVATRPTANNGLGMTVAECEVQTTRLKRLFTLLPDLPTLMAEWEALVVAHDCKGKVAHDARLVAAMRTHHVNEILTFNGTDFQRYPGLTILNPVAISAAAPPSVSP